MCSPVPSQTIFQQQGDLMTSFIRTSSESTLPRNWLFSKALWPWGLGAFSAVVPESCVEQTRYLPRWVDVHSVVLFGICHEKSCIMRRDDVSWPSAPTAKISFKQRSASVCSYYLFFTCIYEKLPFQYLRAVQHWGLVVTWLLLGIAVNMCVFVATGYV